MFLLFTSLFFGLTRGANKAVGVYSGGKDLLVMTVDLKANGNASLATVAGTEQGTYTLDGDKVVIQLSKVRTAFTPSPEGSLKDGPFGLILKKADSKLGPASRKKNWLFFWLKSDHKLLVFGEVVEMGSYLYIRALLDSARDCHHLRYTTPLFTCHQGLRPSNRAVGGQRKSSLESPGSHLPHGGVYA